MTDTWVCVIGGGKSQMPFIEAAGERGLNTVVFDRDPDAPAKGIATEFVTMSTHDTDGVIAYLEAHPRDLVGCFTYSSYEGALLTTSAIVDRFGLRGLRRKALDRMWSKPEMLRALDSAGLATTDWTVTSDPVELEEFVARQGAAIVKPARGGVGSVGVAFVAPGREGIGELLATACAASSDGMALIEGYLAGSEYSVDGYVAGGTAVVLAVSRKSSLGAEGGFVMAGFVTGPGAIQEDVASALTGLADPVLDAAGLDDSYFSLDVIESDGELFVIDVGPLLDAKIDRLLHHAGVDVYGVASDIGLGAAVAIALSPGRAHALRFLYASESGVLAMGAAGRVKTQGGFAHLEFEKAAGDEVRPPESVADVVAWVIGSGSDASLVEADLFRLDLSDRIVISS